MRWPCLFSAEERTLQIKAFRDEIASLTESDDRWVTARVIADSRLGTAYTEKFDAGSIAQATGRAAENARFAGADAGNVLYPERESGDYDGRKGSLTSRTIDEKKAMTLAAERVAKAVDSRIVNVPYCFYYESDAAYAIATTNGLRKTQAASSCGCFVSVMARDGEETQTGSEFALAAGPDALDMDAAARTAAGRALEKLGAQEVDSGAYRVAFDNLAASELLGAFIASPVSPFYGENMQKGRSMLAGKLGETIGSPLFTVVDDPERGLNPTRFDGDGVATRRLALVDHGVFTAVAHNVYSAAREERSVTTGHASRGRNGVGTGLHHPYLAGGDGSLDELLAAMGSGILVTEVAGLHAGLNPVTGDFSLSAKGFRIDGGKRAVPVRNLVVAGNFFELASRLVAKADDARVDTRGGFDAPSVLIDELSVSGR